MSFLQCMLLLIVVIWITTITCFTNDIQSTTTQSLADKVADEIRKIQKKLEDDENQLKLDREELEQEKQIPESIDHTDVLQLNVGGEIIITTRQTLTKSPKSTLSLMFYGRWEHKLQRDQEGNIFLDFNPIVFRHLLDQLLVLGTNNLIDLYPPSQPSLIEPFKKMLRKLGLHQSLSSEKHNVITFNVGGQTITNRRTTFTEVFDSTFDVIASPSQIINFNNQSDVFLDYDLKLFQHLINQLRKKSLENIISFGLSSSEEKVSFNKMLIDLSIYPLISTNTKWKQNGLTVAGGNASGNQLDQLNGPEGIYVDDDHQCIYIAEWNNHRILEWKFGAKKGRVVAGGNGHGNRTDQLYKPRDVTVDKKTDSLIICDKGNRRVVRWSRQNITNGETIISDIECAGLTMDRNGDLYVSDVEKNEVRRWKIGEKTNGIIVAGGNNLDQLYIPTYLFVDKDYSVYVSDSRNHRVMKWAKGAKKGIVVAGGHGQGNNFTQLYHPEGVTVDHFGNVYVADSFNHRIMCWSKGSKQGRIIAGENGQGQQSNQFFSLRGLSFDEQGHLYVADRGNNRVQKFEIDTN